MTKKELSKAVAAKTDNDPIAVEKTLNAIIAVVQQNVKEGRRIDMRGFGTFNSKIRRAKRVQNIKAGTSFIMPSKRIPFFKPSKEFTRTLN